MVDIFGTMLNFIHFRVMYVIYNSLKDKTCIENTKLKSMIDICNLTHYNFQYLLFYYVRDSLYSLYKRAMW